MLGMLTSNAGKGTASQQDVGRGGRKTGGRTWPWPARRHQEEDEVDQPTALDMGKTWLRRHCQPSGSKPAQATTKRTLPVPGHMQAHIPLEARSPSADHSRGSDLAAALLEPVQRQAPRSMTTSPERETLERHRLQCSMAVPHALVLPVRRLSCVPCECLARRPLSEAKFESRILSTPRPQGVDINE